MPKGKELSVEMCELVVQLKRHYDSEKKSGPSVSTKDACGRTAAAFGIGAATVKRIVARCNRMGGKIIPISSRKKRGRRLDETCQSMQVVVRNFVRERNLLGQRVSVGEVRRHLAEGHQAEISKWTLWRALKRWGYSFGQGRRRDSLKERDYVIHARREYLRQIRANRSPSGTSRRPEVYLDETFINKNHSQRLTWYNEEDGPWVNKPSGVGPRLIIVHAITQAGWVNGAELVFKAKKRTGDYHGQMNWENFSKWFSEQLLPNIPQNSLIILDNAKYHNVLVEDRVPGASSTKEELRQWLTRNGHRWRNDMLRSELYKACLKHAPAPEFKLDRLATAEGHVILRTPQYHPELQPIERCWGVVKNYMADHCDFTMSGLQNRLPEALAMVTGATCSGIIRSVREMEDAYWVDDEKLDVAYTADPEEEETVGEYDYSMTGDPDLHKD